MRVGVICEYSGVVRDAFRRRGHDAVSCDLLPTEAEGPHIQGDALAQDWSGFDLLIMHPPCTHLACSGAAWFEKKRADGRQQSGIDLFMAMTRIQCPRWCIENPVGIMSRLYRKPDQIVHPYHFGDEASKATCLWLNGLPPLAIDAPLYRTPNVVGKGEFITYPSGKRMAKWYATSWTKEHGHLRSKTFAGIAEAMADQWGSL